MTDEEREQRRAEQRELVRASVEQLRSSDGWQAYLKARRQFHSYSWRNVLLILHQHPTAQRVAGFRAWLDLGYCPMKGSKAIRIWAPCPPTRRQLQAWRNAGADPDEKPRGGFKLTAVFDRLSRVRHGGCRSTPESRNTLPASLPPVLLVPAGARAKGTAVTCAVVPEPAPEATALRRSRAPRGYPRE
jgi:N-terminal domain of anti-restriction factor ArdC